MGIYQKLGETSGAKAEDAEFFATDLHVSKGTHKVIVKVSGTTGDELEYTLDSGSTWRALATSLTVNTLTTFEIFAVETDLINFRCPTTDGITLSTFEVIEETR